MARTPADILGLVATIISDRGEHHGDYVENMDNIADLWSSFIGLRLTGSQAAVMLALVKVSRMHCGGKEGFDIDDYEDAVGYLAIAAAVAETEKEPTGGPDGKLRVLR
mgnify:CR=1 FL=1